MNIIKMNELFDKGNDIAISIGKSRNMFIFSEKRF